MRFGVLGPLAVWTDDGTPVRIPELKVRALLADLLAYEGRAVSADRLIDDLWGDGLPRNPVNTLQTRVSQLRRALEDAEPGGRELVVSQAPGYLLRVTTDAGRFHSLAERARATLDVRERAALLSEALGLWRGGAFADFADEEFARPVVTRLEDERLAVLEEQAEARLELGEHSLVVGELGDLVARYPLRERLRAVHMRALYRAGRQSEALAGYGELRERLSEELGLDPAPELVALHEAILRQDPGLSVAAPVEQRTNLPAAVTGLVGRGEALAGVRDLLGAARLVTLTGPGGVGKTRLALEAAREVDGFPDGVWLVELAGLEPGSGSGPADVVAAVLGIRDDDAPGTLAEQVEGALRGKRLLLVLDNCEHVVEQVAALVASLLRAAPELRVLATSQESLGLDGEALWAVPPLEEADAVRLFAARATAAAPGFALGPDNAEAVAAICRHLDGIPLALELAATRVRALGVHELAERLDDRFRVLTSGRRDAPARQRTLRAMIDWSWEPLTESERVVLRRLAVHADGCTLAAAEEVCAEDVLDVLPRLVDRSLVFVTDGRYTLLESVKAYCVERLHEAGDYEKTRQRHLDYYTALAESAQRHLYGPGQREWLGRLDQETANLRAALDAATDTGSALRLVNALAWYWILRGRLTEARRSLERALALALGTEARAAAWLAGVVLLGSEGGERAEPVSFGDIEDAGERARAKWFLGYAQRGFSDLSATGELVGAALDEFRALNDSWGVAAALSVRATVGRVRGDLAQAERDAQDSEAIFRELGDRWGVLKATNTLGELSEIAGDYARAARMHREGLRIAEELQLWTDASFRLSGLGRSSLLTGDFAAADDLHERARRMAAGQSNRVAEHFAEMGLALSERRQGRLDAAEARLTKWLDWIAQAIGEPGLALVLAELGFIAEQRGDAARALALHEEGLASARKIGDPRAVALAYEGMAGAKVLEGETVEAARLLDEAAALRESVGAPLPDAERGDVDRISASVRRALGRE